MSMHVYRLIEDHFTDISYKIVVFIVGIVLNIHNTDSLSSRRVLFPKYSHICTSIVLRLSGVSGNVGSEILLTAGIVIQSITWVRYQVLTL